MFSGMLDAFESGKVEAVKYYHDWVEHVKRTVPPNRLLVFESKQGYEPLCKFLNVPIPEEPYPFVNDSGAKQSQYQKGRMIAIILVYGIPTLVSIVAVAIMLSYMH